MNYLWFKIFNKTDFEATGLISRKYTYILEGIGQKDILVTKGIALGLTYEGVFLSLNLLEQNPFEFEGHAIYIDANNDVFLGIEVEDNES